MKEHYIHRMCLLCLPLYHFSCTLFVYSLMCIIYPGNVQSGRVALKNRAKMLTACVISAYNRIHTSCHRCDPATDIFSLHTKCLIAAPSASWRQTRKLTAGDCISFRRRRWLCRCACIVLGRSVRFHQSTV